MYEWIKEFHFSQVCSNSLFLLYSAEEQDGNYIYTTYCKSVWTVYCFGGFILMSLNSFRHLEVCSYNKLCSKSVYQYSKVEMLCKLGNTIHIKEDIYIPETDRKCYQQLTLKSYHWDHIMTAKFNHTFSAGGFHLQLMRRRSLEFPMKLPPPASLLLLGFPPPSDHFVSLTDTVTGCSPQSWTCSLTSVLIYSPCLMLFTVTTIPGPTSQLFFPNSPLQLSISTEYFRNWSYPLLPIPLHPIPLRKHLPGSPAHFPISTAAFLLN